MSLSDSIQRFWDGIDPVILSRGQDYFRSGNVETSSGMTAISPAPAPGTHIGGRWLPPWKWRRSRRDAVWGRQLIGAKQAVDHHLSVIFGLDIGVEDLKGL